VLPRRASNFSSGLEAMPVQFEPVPAETTVQESVS
jgi:hypothetical protein